MRNWCEKPRVAYAGFRMRKMRNNRRYRLPPERRFAAWFTFGTWSVRIRADRPCPPYLLNLYVARGARGFGRYWLSWSLNLSRFMQSSELDRIRKRYPTELEQLAEEIRRHATD